jgi:hypothetical protein
VQRAVDPTENVTDPLGVGMPPTFVDTVAK